MISAERIVLLIEVIVEENSEIYVRIIRKRLVCVCFVSFLSYAVLIFVYCFLIRHDQSYISDYLTDLLFIYYFSSD